VVSTTLALCVLQTTVTCKNCHPFVSTHVVITDSSSLPSVHKSNPRFELNIGHPINHSRVTRKHDMLEGNTSDEASPNNSASDFSDGTPSPPADVDITYSFDASRGPTQGNQIFNVALAQAVEKFEERETVKLVKNEYDVLDADGESVAAPSRKTQAKARGMGATRVPDADEDYEFV